ncbi:MAG: CocE/NonD family hydrolase [Labilithrix sp.]|nr:CocE/NonD family hydrolase [Labilithrix sp.]
MRTSRYLIMRDGVRIAIDVCLPRGLPPGARVPAIVRQTRYFRRFLVRKRARAFMSEATFDPMNAPMRALFTSRGYAWVDVDARGSGASFGERPCPWYLEGEVKDGAEIVDYIVSQPWSNGRVGSTGVSYDGTTADFLASTRHPAVRAIAPRFALFDVFADVAFPGGLHQAWFTETWERANAALDRNSPADFIGTTLSFGVHGAPSPRVAREGTLAHALAKLADREIAQTAFGKVLGWAVGGVPPVDDDRGGEILASAVASHGKNYSVHDGAVHMTFRDDSPPNAPIPGFTSEIFSPANYADAIGSAAVLSYGGWWDSGYANAAVKRFGAVTASGPASTRADHRLLLGPWVHGGTLDMDPDTAAHPAAFDHAAELLRFFDRHLEPTVEAAHVEPVRYYLMGAGEWRSSTRWPPEGVRSLPWYLGRGRTLTRARPPERDAVDVHEVDPTTRTGLRSRWRTLVSPFVHVDGAGRSARGLLVYESDPLDEDLDVVGHPVLVLAVSSSVPDGAILAYLDDVPPSGSPRLVSEGALRTIHRTRLADEETVARVEMTFLRKDALALGAHEPAVHAVELLPLAMRFRRGHRVRLSLAGADVDHFATPAGPSGQVPTVWRVDRAGSRLLLPVHVARASGA